MKLLLPNIKKVEEKQVIIKMKLLLSNIKKVEEKTVIIK